MAEGSLIIIRMSNEDVSEKTSIVSGDTFSGRMRQAADEAPPAFVVLMAPPAYVGKQFPLNKNEYILGRSHECAIQIDDKSVSRSHVHIKVVGAEVSISDMDSANKTVVNGATLKPGVPFKLRNNDQIKTGNVILKFHQEWEWTIARASPLAAIFFLFSSLILFISYTSIIPRKVSEKVQPAAKTRLSLLGNKKPKEKNAF